jgi:2-amino-4-hydroxy-6-hydroxymethyldihydropteridine diphosphokinase
MALGDRPPRRRDPLLDVVRAIGRLRVQDEHGDVRHVAESRHHGRHVLKRIRAYIGLGANLDDAAATIGRAVRALAALPGFRPHAVSRLYITTPVGVPDQPPFRNAVVSVDVPAGPEAATGATTLLIALKKLERAFGRQERERWGPRELDLDLLVFGRARLSLDRPPAGLSLDPGKAARLLVVPHPEAAERLFVLAPLADVAAGLVPPGWHETVASAARRRASIEGPDAVRPVATWNADRSIWEPLPED